MREAIHNFCDAFPFHSNTLLARKSSFLELKLAEEKIKVWVWPMVDITINHCIIWGATSASHGGRCRHRALSLPWPQERDQSQVWQYLLFWRDFGSSNFDYVLWILDKMMTNEDRVSALDQAQGRLPMHQARVEVLSVIFTTTNIVIIFCKTLFQHVHL